MSPRGLPTGTLVLLAVLAASGRSVPADEGHAPPNLRSAVERFDKAVSTTVDLVTGDRVFVSR